MQITIDDVAVGTKTLVFEGAGWDEAAHNGVGNCRIRTRLTNNEGKKIYLEMTGRETTKHSHYDFTGYVWYCFEADCNEKSEYRRLERMTVRYTKESILELVNTELNCSYDEFEVINDNSVRVHDTSDELC